MSEWYYASMGQRVGPITHEQIKELAGNGTLKPMDLVWCEGMPDWAPAAKVRELFPQAESPLPPYTGRSERTSTAGERRPWEDDDAPRRSGDDSRRPRRDYDGPSRRSRPKASGSSALLVSCIIGGALLLVLAVAIVIIVAADSAKPAPHQKLGAVIPLVQGTGPWHGALTCVDVRDHQGQGGFCKVYSFTMTAGQSYQIDLASADFDAYLRLIDPNGVCVAVDDDSGGGVNGQDVRIVYQANMTGPYRIIATTLNQRNQSEIGGYDLNVNLDNGFAPQPPKKDVDQDKPLVPLALLPNQLVLKEGFVHVSQVFLKNSPRNTKSWPIRLERNKKYSFQASGTTFLPILAVEDANHFPVRGADFETAGKDRTVKFTCQREGIYYAVVRVGIGRSDVVTLDITDVTDDE